MYSINIKIKFINKYTINEIKIIFEKRSIEIISILNNNKLNIEIGIKKASKYLYFFKDIINII